MTQACSTNLLMCVLLVVHPGRAWSSSPACTWHCSLHYLFLQATPLFPHDVTIVCYPDATIIGKRGRHVPQHFRWGDAKVNVPTPIAHLVKFLGHILFIKGVLYYQNSISFQLQEGYAPLILWPGALPLDPAGGFSPRPPTIQKKSPPLMLPSLLWLRLTVPS